LDALQAHVMSFGAVMRWYVFPVTASVVAAVLIFSGWLGLVPLGIPNQWTWNRTAALPAAHQWILPIFADLVYTAFVLVNMKLLSRAGRWAEWILVPALLVVAGVVQWSQFDLPAIPSGLERWPFSLAHDATSGYFSQARRITDVREFVANYEDWVAQQDPFHIGTHPPGLFILHKVLLDWFAANPDGTAAVLAAMPERFRSGMAELMRSQPMLAYEQAELFAAAMLTFSAGLLTIVPIYAFIRLSHSAATAWLGAALWPLAPAVPLFLPLADAIYPLPAFAIVFLICWSLKRRLAFFAVIAGLVFAIGLTFTLAFVAVLPIVVGVLVLSRWHEPTTSWGRIVGTLIAFAAGTALPIEYAWHQLHLNLPIVWGTNLEKHAEFYEVWPRSYGPWLIVNLVEFSVMSGPALIVACLCALCRRPRRWVSSWSTMVNCCWLGALLALDISGRNLGEVGRLWIFLTPFACVGAVAEIPHLRPPSALVAVWLGAQVLVVSLLLACVEPLLPVALPAPAQ
jgi:hypothetical protein